MKQTIENIWEINSPVPKVICQWLILNSLFLEYNSFLNRSFAALLALLHLKR